MRSELSALPSPEVGQKVSEVGRPGLGQLRTRATLELLRGRVTDLGELGVSLVAVLVGLERTKQRSESVGWATVVMSGRHDGRQTRLVSEGIHSSRHSGSDSGVRVLGNVLVGLLGCPANGARGGGGTAEESAGGDGRPGTGVDSQRGEHVLSSSSLDRLRHVVGSVLDSVPREQEGWRKGSASASAHR